MYAKKQFCTWHYEKDQDSGLESYDLINASTEETVAIIVPNNIYAPLCEKQNAVLSLKQKVSDDWSDAVFSLEDALQRGQNHAMQYLKTDNIHFSIFSIINHDQFKEEEEAPSS